MQINVANPEQVAKRALFLAYNAACLVGMGILQARDNVDEDSVWNNALTKGDYPLRTDTTKNKHLFADYVFGRMMKLSLSWDATSVTVPDATPRADYQSWCSMYPTYESLVKAADEAVNNGPTT